MRSELQAGDKVWFRSATQGDIKAVVVRLYNEHNDFTEQTHHMAKVRITRRGGDRVYPTGWVIDTSRTWIRPRS